MKQVASIRVLAHFTLDRLNPERANCRPDGVGVQPESPRLLRRGYFPSRLLERGKLERSRAVLDGSSGLKGVPSSRGRSATLRQGCSRGFFALFRKEGSSVQAVLAPIHSDVRAICAIYRDFVEMNQRTSIPRRPLLSAQRVSPLTYRRW